jgi:hypothetical protein
VGGWRGEGEGPLHASNQVQCCERGVNGIVVLWCAVVLRTRLAYKWNGSQLVDQLTVRCVHPLAGCSSFSIWTEFAVPTGKRSETPERNAIGHMHARASSEQA